MKSSEPSCVVLKRRGAEHVASEIAGLEQKQEIEYWRKRSKKLRALQEGVARRMRQTDPTANQGFVRAAESSVALRG